VQQVTTVYINRRLL